MTGRAVVAWLAQLYPWPVESSDDLRQALIFLDWQLGPEQIVRAGYGAGLVAGSVSVLLVPLVPGQFQITGILVAIAVGLLTIHAVHTLPQLIATARRTRALGATPDLVARATLSMRLTPTPERAAQFTAESGNDILASSLARHIRQTRNTARSGLSTFADAWGNLFPPLRRSCALISAAGATPASDRDQLLDRALSIVLEGTRDQMQSFAARIQTPTTALYAFGVLLPTALIALLPAASTANLPITTTSVVFVYDLLLPVGLFVVSAYLLANRPVAFPPPNITSDNPQVPDRSRIAVLVGSVVAAGAAILTSRFLPAWGPPIAAVGLGAGLALWIHYRPVISVYERVQLIEEELPEALALVGRRVTNGRAVETAISQTATELDGAAGTVLEAGATQQRQLQVGVREAFLGRHGTLNDLSSPRIRGSLALLSLAADEGQPAGDALIALSGHIEDLQEIEQEARHTLSHVCRTLRTTGALFGPMVAGSTVALADGIDGGEFLPGGGQSMPWLGAAVGWYVLVLAVLLTALATGLTRGLDRSLVGYRVGQSLVAATVSFLCSYFLVSLIFM